MSSRPYQDRLVSPYAPLIGRERELLQKGAPRVLLFRPHPEVFSESAFSALEQSLRDLASNEYAAVVRVHDFCSPSVSVRCAYGLGAEAAVVVASAFGTTYEQWDNRFERLPPRDEVLRVLERAGGSHLYLKK